MQDGPFDAADAAPTEVRVRSRSPEFGCWVHAYYPASDAREGLAQLVIGYPGAPDVPPGSVVITLPDFKERPTAK